MSPVRTFASGDRITTALGSLGFAFGPGSLVAIVRRSSAGAAAAVIVIDNSGLSSGQKVRLAVTAADLLELRCEASAVAAPSITVPSGGWYLVGATKATGTVAPRFHRYNFATATATHEDAGSSLANSTAPTANGRLGNNGPSNLPFIGDIAIAGVSNAVLSDAAFEALAISAEAWAAAGLIALWPLDQASTATAVQDTIGAADQTALVGTSVLSEEVPWVGSGFTASAAQTLSALTQAATGAYAAPTFTATSAQTLPTIGTSSTGTTQAPSFTATVAQTLPVIGQAANGTTAAPTFGGEVEQTLPAITQAAVGEAALPIFTAAAAQALPAISQTATGSAQAPTFTATSAQTLPIIEQNATSTTAPPRLTASVGQDLPALAQSATGGHAPPTFTAIVAQTLPALTQRAANLKPVVRLVSGTRTADLTLVAATRTPPLTLEVT